MKQATCRALARIVSGDYFFERGEVFTIPLAHMIRLPQEALQVLKVEDAPEHDAPPPIKAGTADIDGAQKRDRMQRKEHSRNRAIIDNG